MEKDPNMRRFSLIVFAAAALIILLFPKAREEAKSPVQQIASAAIRPEIPVTPSMNGVMQRLPASAIEDKASRKSEPPQGSINVVSAQAYETYAPAHIPSSAKSGGLDASKSEMPDDDLPLAAQRELARLGCYDAKIDGVWGRKSRLAVKTISDRANRNWDAEPSRDLIAALRAAPDGVCQSACAKSSSAGQCALALATQTERTGDPKSAEAKPDDASYLPPWMRGEKLASIAPDGAVSDAQRSVSDSAGKAKPRPERRRESGGRFEQPVQKRRFSEWQPPEGWPGTGR